MCAKCGWLLVCLFNTCGSLFILACLRETSPVWLSPSPGSLASSLILTGDSSSCTSVQASLLQSVRENSSETIMVSQLRVVAPSLLVLVSCVMTASQDRIVFSDKRHPPSRDEGIPNRTSSHEILLRNNRTAPNQRFPGAVQFKQALFTMATLHDTTLITSSSHVRVMDPTLPRDLTHMKQCNTLERHGCGVRVAATKTRLKRVCHRPKLVPGGHTRVNAKLCLSDERKIPLDLIMRLSSLESYTDLQNFIDVESLGSNSLDTSLAKAVLSPKPATCKPESRTVPLTNSMDPSLFYFPTCTRVDLCGGCCSSELLSCQPTQTEILNYQVIVTQYDGGAQLKYKGKEIVSVEQHLKCKCDCTVKEKVGMDHYSGARETTPDCTRLQEYRAGECRCVCLNVDDERKCNADNDTKLWDSNSCVCACRENKECSTGLYFDQNSCKYVKERSRLKSQLREGLLGAGGTGKLGDIPTGRFDLGWCKYFKTSLNSVQKSPSEGVTSASRKCADAEERYQP
uniref:Platelet-derived growth factor (PDGF) family profile domain-containing protein n=1 Tax=Timema genevievae TaxID=629358 RepID=A0A7R9JZ53_TIMGE|nr:unnamed protein product [Timema genevievae]